MIILKVLLMIIFYLILFLLAVTFIFLISPIKGYATFDVDHLYFKGSYLFGLIRIKYTHKKLSIRLFGFKLKNDKSETDKEEKKDLETKEEPADEVKEKKEKKKKKFKRPSKEVIVLTLRFVKKIIKKIAPRKATLHLTLGLDEPYYTGMIHLVSIFFFMPLNKIKHYDFRFTPVHDDIAINYRGEALISFSIMSLIIPAVRFILRKPIRQYLGIKLNFKFKRKQEQTL